MHREHGRRPQRGEGIANQEEAAPDGTAVLLARVPGLLPQPLHHRIQQLPRLTAHRGLKPQGQLQLTGTDTGRKGLDHRHGAIRGRQPEIHQITGLRLHIPHDHLPVGAEHHVGFFTRLLPVAGGRSHHGGAADQHLPRQHRHLIGHLPVNGTAGMGHQPVQGAIGVTEDAGRIGIVLNGSLAECTASLLQPVLLHQAAHLPLRIPDRRQQWRHLTGQPSFPEASRQLQHRALMAHHLAKGRRAGALHGEHRAALLPHRRQLSRITDEHQPGFEGVSALKSDPEKRAVDHGGLVHQHQSEMLKSHRRLLRRLAQLGVALPLQLQTQQAVNRGGVPGRAEALQIEGLTQHPHRLMGRRHHGPAEATGLHLTQQAHGEERLAAAGETAQHKRRSISRRCQPCREGIGSDLLITGEFSPGVHPSSTPHR